MKKKYLLITICLITAISYTGCQSEVNNTKNGDNKPSTSASQSPISTNISTNDETDIEFDTEFLKDATKKLDSIGISDCWVGYDVKGDISVWVNLLEEEKKFNNSVSFSKYNAFIVKKVYETYSDVDNVFSMFNFDVNGYSFYSFKKGKYLNSELKEAPSNYEDFNISDNTWEEVIDKHFVPSNLVVQAYDKYDPQIAFRRLVKELYGDRLIDVSIEDIVIGAIRAKITANGLPQSISVNDEIAKVFVLGMGRFSDNLQFDNIYDMSITYKDGENNILKTSMYRGVEKEPTQDFIGWLASGLNSKDFSNYAKIKISDSNFKFPEVTNNIPLSPKRIYADPGYAKVMDTIKELKGVKDLVLGYDGSTYNALVIMGYTGEEEDFKNEMDITLKAMQYPFETIWFMAEDSNGTTKNMAYIDRERYNILNYMNDGSKFDFIPKEWPIMAKAFGEVK